MDKKKRNNVIKALMWASVPASVVGGYYVGKKVGLKRVPKIADKMTREYPGIKPETINDMSRKLHGFFRGVGASSGILSAIPAAAISKRLDKSLAKENRRNA